MQETESNIAEAPDALAGPLGGSQRGPSADCSNSEESSNPGCCGARHSRKRPALPHFESEGSVGAVTSDWLKRPVAGWQGPRAVLRGDAWLEGLDVG